MKIRLPEELRDAIARSAEANKRSMNAEIVERLEASYEFEKPFSDQALFSKILNEKYGAREAASNAAQIALYGFAEAFKAASTGDSKNALQRLDSITKLLALISDDHEPYERLIECRNWIVHHSKDQDFGEDLLNRYLRAKLP